MSEGKHYFGKLVFPSKILGFTNIISEVVLRRFKISSRLIASFLLLSILPLTIVGTVSIQKSSEAMKENISKYSIQIVNLINSNIAAEFKKYEDISLEILISEELENYCASLENNDEIAKVNSVQELNSYLKNKAAALSTIDRIDFYDNTSENYVSTYGYISSYISKAQKGGMFDRIMKSDGTPTWVFMNKSEDGRTLNLLFLFRKTLRAANDTNNGKSTGVLSITLKQDALFKLFSNIDIGVGGEILILNEENTIISAKNPNKIGTVIEKKLSDTFSIKNTKNETQYKFIKLNNVETLVCYSRIDKLGWKVISTVPFKFLMQKTVQITVYIILLMIICFVFAVIISRIVTRSVSYPIKCIGDAIEDIKKGDFSRVLDIKYNDEITKISLGLNNMVDNISPIIGESFLEKLVKGDTICDDQMVKNLSRFGIIFPCKFFTVLVFELESLDSNVKKTELKMPEIMVVMFKSLTNILKELHYTGYILDIEGDKIVFLLNADDDNIISETSSLMKILRQLKDKVEDDFQITITVSIGNVYNNIKMINQSFEEAIQALNYKILTGKGKFIDYHKVEEQNEYSYYYPMEKELKLIQSLDTANYKEIENILDEIIQKNLFNRSLDFNVARCLFYDLEATALKTLEKINLTMYSNQIVTHKLASLNTFEDMIFYIKIIYRDICELIRSKKEQEGNDLINSIVDDIEKNYTDGNYSLDDVVKKFNVSKSFISRFFKEQKGEYYSDYLNKKRIDKAKQLLDNSSMTINDIAQRVGYLNDITFRRIFKRFEFITPGQYRENKKTMGQ
jgi:AraC-type DNA-binding domain-containing proteins